MADLALEAARLGGIGHISDAMVNTVADRRYNAKFVKEKLQQYKFNVSNPDKSVVQFDLGQLAEATRLHVGKTMEAKRGEGMIRQLHGKADHECAQGNGCAFDCAPRSTAASTVSRRPLACTLVRLP